MIPTGTPDSEKFTFQLSPVSLAALLIPRHGPFAVSEKLVFAQLVKNSPRLVQSVTCCLQSQTNRHTPSLHNPVRLFEWKHHDVLVT